MKIDRMTLATEATIPLMAALPYRITSEEGDEEKWLYDPKTQATQFAGRNFCTCRVDESVGGLFSSKSDTKKDD